ncbi:hypothetical protein HID58_061570, partial [Brassica napus]
FHISPTKVPYEDFSNEQGNSNGCAEKKLFENNYSRAKIFINQAKSLDIDLGCLNQVLIMIDFVANEETVKKLHKKLALFFISDKNKFNGAKGTF